MNPYYELAFALESKSICFFVGTGFSMHLTNSKAPNWLQLLKKCANTIEDGENLIKLLFPEDIPIMPLEECASIIQIKMHREGKCLYSEITKIIKKLKLGKNIDITKEFINEFSHLKFITTNYDELIEKNVLKESDSTAYSIGHPINRQPRGIQVYHMHGSVKNPKKMIVTADDYYRFINKSNYFSKKVHTLIEENTTVIMGYSLGDINFKSILNNLCSNRLHDINRQNLFFLSRDEIDTSIKDYYDKSYGLRVIDNTEIEDFFEMLIDKHERIKSRVSKSRDTLMTVLYEEKRFTDTYLKKKDSFFEIMATLFSNGILISHPDITKLLKSILERKDAFTDESGAWSQYVHLSNWLVYLGSIMDIRETDLKKTYMDAVNTSFKVMSKTNQLGYSWGAYKVWKREWEHITYDNRNLIIEFYKTNHISSDAKEIICQ